MPERLAEIEVKGCHCVALRRAARRISSYYDEVLAPSGVRVAQFSILAAIDSLAEPTINSIAQALDLDRTTTGKNLRLLEVSGHIVTERSDHDGRSRVARITEYGRLAFEQAKKQWDLAQRALEQVNGSFDLIRLDSQLAGLRVPGER
ncbi:MAG: winged helix-turn-helix transcriptional regulator [Rhodospirillales bacterium]|nr:winged helix-turn-helix transcriptional regulator [Rhodospirillales bacterium]